TEIRQSGIAGGNSVAEKGIHYEYDKSNLLKRMDSYANTALTQSVATTFYQRDGIGRLSQLQSYHASTAIRNDTYSHDDASGITQISSSVDGVSSYQYDATSQLTAADHSSGQPDESYTYDANGNRRTGGYQVGADNQLLRDATYRYEYDAEGNRTARVSLSSG